MSGFSEAAPGLPARARHWIALGGCAALLAHAYVYRFVCDDAFISFRYARNLAEGVGLVFNPGEAPVEGYSNFLWVLGLAAGATAGVAAETLAPLLSLAATAALAWRIAYFACREGIETSAAGRWVAALAPPILLAATRSVALWSTSGLETRLFELLVVCGLLRLRSEIRVPAPARPLSALLFVAACWTRPDGALIAGACFTAGFVCAPRAARRQVLASALLCAAGILAQLGFRLAYYGEWLPNTFYAKVGGRLWPEMGWIYAEAFALEYLLWLWIPLAAIGARARWRAGDRTLPVLVAAALLPHAAYVIAIGGDHFEFRPFDLVFPLLFLLVGDGLGSVCARSARAAGAAIAVGLAGLALHVELPLRTRANFPERYVSGFPGAREGPATRDYLQPDAGWLSSLPGIRVLAARHRELLFELTRHFVGIRAEEHARFVDDAHREGRALARLVELGVLPGDAHIATDSVGAIPYDSRLRTLDRLGLTDAVVARSKFVRPELLGHGKTASLDYARAIGVDLWAVDPVHLLWLPFDPSLPERLEAWREAELDVHFAAVGAGLYLVAHLPQGIDRARERFPKLTWRSAFGPEARELIRHE